MIARRRGYGATFKFEQGECDFERGLDREDCPYPPDTEERAQWLAGWEYAWWAACGDADLAKWGERGHV